MDPVVVVSAVAAGGDGVAREESGRVVFVAGALPGERVRVRIRDERRDFARADLLDVLTAAPARVAPPCPYVAAGCGGCRWQHVAPATQSDLKAAIVADALVRIGGVAAPLVAMGPPLPTVGFRTTVRAAVTDGRLGFRRTRSHAVVPVEHCLVAHPLLQDILATARFPGAAEVVLRCSVATGERVAWLRPRTRRAHLPPDVAVGPRAAVHEEVAGRTWRISAASFFQVGPRGAGALVDVVRAAAGTATSAADGAPLVDAYCGVGLFAGALGAGRPVVAIDASPAAVADAKVNLAGRAATVVLREVERWRPPSGLRPGLVVADPARTGLGARAITALAGLGAPRLVLVSCDAAALGRDAGLLAGHGYRHRMSTLVDLFPHTPHVEVVTRFDRA